MEQIEGEKLTLALSFIAYKGLTETEPGKIRKAIQDGLDILKPDIGEQKLVWGPAIHKLGLEVFSDALMFVVQSVDNPSEYTVAIRGTSPLSLGTLMLQDLWVKNQVYWDTGNAPANVKISIGSYLGLHFLQKLRPNKNNPGSKKTILDFFREVISSNGKTRINITGHSLGGTLASTLALWFKDKSHFEWPDKSPDIFTYSYAGLTTGNRAFAGYSNRILGKKCHRFYNPLDVAPLMFNRISIRKFPNIYKPHNPIDIIMWLLYKWISRKVRYDGYTQIKNHVKIESKINKSKWFFCTQLDYQHTVAYVNRLAALISDEKSEAGKRDGQSIIKELDLQGVTERFSLQNILRIIKKVFKKFIGIFTGLFKSKRERARTKINKRK